MKINFYPFRRNMCEEIEQCEVTNKADNLLSFCKSCVFMTVSRIVEPECFNCMVHDAITKILLRTRFESVMDEETPGACYDSNLQERGQSLSA